MKETLEGAHVNVVLGTGATLLPRPSPLASVVATISEFLYRRSCPPPPPLPVATPKEKPNERYRSRYRSLKLALNVFSLKLTNLWRKEKTFEERLLPEFLRSCNFCLDCFLVSIVSSSEMLVRLILSV